MPDTPRQLQLRKALSYANGYRELGMFKEAFGELDRLPVAMHQTEPVLQMKLAVCMDSKTWVQARQIAKKLLEHDPTESGHYINLAYVTRRAESMAEAKWILLDAVSKFPSEALVHYNLGCYECAEGNLEEAKKRLLVAFSLDAKFRKTAREDADLSEMQLWLDSLDQQ